MKKFLIAAHVAAPGMLFGLSLLPGEHVLLMSMAAILSGVGLSMASTAHALRNASLGVISDAFTTGVLLFVLFAAAFVGAARYLRETITCLPPLLVYGLILFTDGCLAGLAAGASVVRILKFSAPSGSK